LPCDNSRLRAGGPSTVEQRASRVAPARAGAEPPCPRSRHESVPTPSVIAASNELELLAPAKNADIGIEAVNHGADASTSAARRSARARRRATRCRHRAPDAPRHRYGAKIFITLNTILRDDELEARAAWPGRSTRPAPMR
jgi:hypothetical protein